jgi:uncharacterized protein
MNNAHYLNPRVLKINVGFLLSAPAGTSQDSTFEFPEVRVSDDLALRYLRGPIRLSRNKEGVLVQATLHAGLQTECYRCLEPVQFDSVVTLEELFTSGDHTGSEFHIGDDAILDMIPLLRAEILMNTDSRVLCKQDCKGLCPECGVNRNHVTCSCAEEQIDPRLAALRKLLDVK